MKAQQTQAPNSTYPRQMLAARSNRHRARKIQHAFGYRLDVQTSFHSSWKTRLRCSYCSACSDVFAHCMYRTQRDPHIDRSLCVGLHSVGLQLNIISGVGSTITTIEHKDRGGIPTPPTITCWTCSHAKPHRYRVEQHNTYSSSMWRDLAHFASGISMPPGNAEELYATLCSQSIIIASPAML